MNHSIEKREIQPQPVLVERRRVKPTELASELGPMFGRVHHYAQQHGAALAGWPIVRYLECGPGLWTIEAGMPVIAAPTVSADSGLTAETLPGGPVAFVLHTGPYDQLMAVHAAVQQWIESKGFHQTGPAWESYINDPADYPDPQDWKTEVFCPISTSK